MNNDIIENNESFSDFLNEYVELTENAEKISKEVLTEAVNSKTLNEFLNEGDEDMEESLTEEEIIESEEDAAEEDDMISTTDVDDEGDEYDSEEETEIDSEEEESIDPLSEFEPNENGDYDLTDVDDPEKIMNILNNAPTDAKVVIVKKASFDVEVEDSSEGTEMDSSDSIDIEDENQEVDFDMEESPVEEEINEESDVDDDYVNESVSKILKIKNAKLKIYENKLREMQSALKTLHEQNTALEAKEVEYKKTLTESKKFMQKMALINKNLAFTSKLFTEHSTTKAEKEEILKEFEETQTIRESEIKYNFYNRQLLKRTPNESAKKNLIEEASKVIKKPKTVVKESASFKKEPKKVTSFSRFANYKNNNK